MTNPLSFSPEFFWGHTPHPRPGTRPTSVLQALISLPSSAWDALAQEIFQCPPDALDPETVIRMIIETNACRNVGPPVEVFIDPDGWHAVFVPDRAN